MPVDITAVGAARFGLMLEAVKRADLAQAAEMLVSISSTDIEAIKARLAEFGLNTHDLVATLSPEGATP